MKVDIKSFLIGILTTVNLFLLMGFDDHEEEKEIGKYKMTIWSSEMYVFDTTTGEVVEDKSKMKKAWDTMRGRIKESDIQSMKND